MELLNYPTDIGRSRGDLPELPIINMFAEDYLPEGKTILQSRPGLGVVTTVGSHPIRYLYSEPGVFSTGLFAVSDSSLYRDGSYIGTINGDDAVSMDSFTNTTFITAGQGIWAYNGSSLITVPFPDGSSSLRLCVAASRLVVIKKETQRIYWSDVLSSNIDSLSFAEAENSPDNLRDILFIGDSLVLFGESTTEFWMLSTDPDIPFTPLQGRVFSKGVKNTGAATKLSTGFVWVTDTNQVCFNTPENIISTRNVEEAFGAESSVSLWTFYLDNIEFLAATLENETWIFNSLTKTWSRFETYGIDGWEPSCYAKGVFGSSTSGRILQWTDSHIDPDSTNLERRFRVWAPLDTASVVIKDVLLRTNSGETPNDTGEYINPTVEFRLSKDGGEIWSSWRSAKMGLKGKYRTSVRWLSLGLFSQPGALLEFRITDPTPFRVSSVSINNPYGGY